MSIRRPKFPQLKRAGLVAANVVSIGSRQICLITSSFGVLNPNGACNTVKKLTLSSIMTGCFTLPITGLAMGFTLTRSISFLLLIVFGPAFRRR